MVSRADAVSCEHQDQHPRINERLDQLERRAEKWDAFILDHGTAISEVKQTLASMNGQLAGALRASRIIGALLGAVVTAGLALAGVLLSVRR